MVKVVRFEELACHKTAIALLVIAVLVIPIYRLKSYNLHHLILHRFQMIRLRDMWAFRPSIYLKKRITNHLLCTPGIAYRHAMVRIYTTVSTFLCKMYQTWKIQAEVHFKCWWAFMLRLLRWLGVVTQQKQNSANDAQQIEWKRSSFAMKRENALRPNLNYAEQLRYCINFKTRSLWGGLTAHVTREG